MVKHTQTIHRQKPTNCLSVFNHFVELTLKGLTEIYAETQSNIYDGAESVNYFRKQPHLRCFTGFGINSCINQEE